MNEQVVHRLPTILAHKTLTDNANIAILISQKKKTNLETVSKGQAFDIGSTHWIFGSWFPYV